MYCLRISGIVQFVQRHIEATGKQTMLPVTMCGVASFRIEWVPKPLDVIPKAENELLRSLLPTISRNMEHNWLYYNSLSKRAVLLLMMRRFAMMS